MIEWSFDEVKEWEEYHYLMEIGTMSLWFLRFECYQLLLFIWIHSLTNVKIIVEVKESLDIISTIKEWCISKKSFPRSIIFYEWSLIYKIVLARTIGFIWKYCKLYTKKRKKNLDFQLFCRKNELSLRLLIYKLRLNNIILQAINHVMSKVNRFL